MSHYGLSRFVWENVFVLFFCCTHQVCGHCHSPYVSFSGRNWREPGSVLKAVTSKTFGGFYVIRSKTFVSTLALPYKDSRESLL